jgi:ADP-heptose:LPS heptosyltransferase
MRMVTFKNFFAPGDCLVSTAAIRDLHLSYPFEFQIDMQSCYPEVFYNNPNINGGGNKWGVTELNPFEWKYKNQDSGHHYSDAYYYLIEGMLNVKIKKTSMFPEIFLTDREKDPEITKRLGIDSPYWIINSGFKNDIPLKQYPAILWQQVVNKLRVSNLFGYDLVQTGHSHHNHPALSSVKNLIGKTDNIRDYFSLIYHSSGVICHVSFPMHIAAAFHKPCVVIAGGRENFRWEQYPGHQFLHTIGKLDCCRESGCWKVNFSDCDNFSQYPACYRLIDTEDVVKAVLSY